MKIIKYNLDEATQRPKSVIWKPRFGHFLMPDNKSFMDISAEYEDLSKDRPEWADETYISSPAGTFKCHLLQYEVGNSCEEREDLRLGEESDITISVGGDQGMEPWKALGHAWDVMLDMSLNSKRRRGAIPFEVCKSEFTFYTSKLDLSWQYPQFPYGEDDDNVGFETWEESVHVYKMYRHHDSFQDRISLVCIPPAVREAYSLNTLEQDTRYAELQAEQKACQRPHVRQRSGGLPWDWGPEHEHVDIMERTAWHEHRRRVVMIRSVIPTIISILRAIRKIKLEQFPSYLANAVGCLSLEQIEEHFDISEEYLVGVLKDIIPHRNFEPGIKVPAEVDDMVMVCRYKLSRLIACEHLEGSQWFKPVSYWDYHECLKRLRLKYIMKTDKDLGLPTYLTWQDNDLIAYNRNRILEAHDRN